MGISETGTLPPRREWTVADGYEHLNVVIAALEEARDDDVLRRAMQHGVELAGLAANARPVVAGAELREILVEALRFAQRRFLAAPMQGIA